MAKTYASLQQYYDTGKTDSHTKNVEYHLQKATRDIDVLTFNRITDFDKLSDFQKEIIREVCIEHASFLIDNEDTLKTYLSSYSINGVSMTFGNAWNLYISSGVAMDKSLYSRLSSTGLCCRSFNY